MTNLELDVKKIEAAIQFLSLVRDNLKDKETMDFAVSAAECLIKTPSKNQRLTFADKSSPGFNQDGNLATGAPFELQQPGRFTNQAFITRGLRGCDLSDRERVILNSAILTAEDSLYRELADLLILDLNAPYDTQVNQQLISTEIKRFYNSVFYQFLSTSGFCKEGQLHLQSGYDMNEELKEAFDKKIRELSFELSLTKSLLAKAKSSYPPTDIMFGSGYNQVTKKEINEKFAKDLLERPPYFTNQKLHVTLQLNNISDYEKAWEKIVLSIFDNPAVYAVKLISPSADPNKVQVGKQITLYFIDPRDMTPTPTETEMHNHINSVVTFLDSLVFHNKLTPSDPPKGETIAGTEMGCKSRAIYFAGPDHQSGQYVVANDRLQADQPMNVHLYMTENNKLRVLLIIDGFLDLLPTTRGIAEMKKCLEDSNFKSPDLVLNELIVIAERRLSTATQIFFTRDTNIDFLYKQISNLRELDFSNDDTINSFKQNMIHKLLTDDNELEEQNLESLLEFIKPVVLRLLIPSSAENTVDLTNLNKIHNILMNDELSDKSKIRNLMLFAKNKKSADDCVNGLYNTLTSINLSDYKLDKIKESLDAIIVLAETRYIPKPSSTF